MFFLLLLRADLTDENWEKTMETYSDIPKFLFCFAEWCPHCKRAHPGWTKFGEEMVDRTDVLIGTVNCTNEKRICEEVLHVHYYPTFMVQLENETKEVRLMSMEATYPRVVERTLMRKNGTLVQEIEGAPTEFPTVVFELNGTDEEGRKMAFDAAVDSTYLQSVKFAYNTSEAGGRRVVAWLDRDCVVEMNGEWTPEALAEFLSEHCHAVFGREWSMWTVRQLKRKFTMVLSENETYLNELRPLAKEYQRELAFGIVGKQLPYSKAYQYFKASKKDLPLVVVVNLRDRMFVKLPKAGDVQAVNKFLREFRDRPGDITWDMMDVRSDIELFIDIAAKTAKIVVVCLVSSVAIALLVFLLIYLRKRKTHHVPKID